jgi:hypothetical protein
MKSDRWRPGAMRILTRVRRHSDLAAVACGSDTTSSSAAARNRRFDGGERGGAPERWKGAARKAVLAKDPFGCLHEIGARQVDCPEVPHVELRHDRGVDAALQRRFRGELRR